MVIWKSSKSVTVFLILCGAAVAQYLYFLTGGKLHDFSFSTGHTTLNVQMLNQRQLIIVALINIPFSLTDTWGQLVSTTLNHKTCINTSRQVLEKTLFAFSAIVKRALMAHSVFF